MNIGQGTKERIRFLLAECGEAIREVKKQKDREPKNTVLTYEASKVHYKLEKKLSDVRKYIEKSSTDLAENLPLSTIESVLPDIFVAAVLWFEKGDLLKGVEGLVGSLGDMFSSIEQERKEEIEKKAEDLRQKLQGLLDEIEVFRPPGSRLEFLRNHDFLSQQIDERSHQFFSMGSLFVPVSFLVFASAVTGMAPRFLEGVPLMFASLTCYLVWFIMYLRNGKLNRYSYPIIHSLELVLGLSTHSALGDIARRDPLVRIRQQPFYYAFYMLVTLWLLYVTDTVDTVAVGASLLITIVVSLFWRASADTRYVVMLTFLLESWALLAIPRIFPPVMSLFSVPPLLMWLPFLVFWVVCFAFISALVNAVWDP